ncbi:hypothetical protein KJI95_18770 [Shewanella sp. JM162201]|uniref:Uncharacterized protein n=1 Tax=Shewanella jiangmenensis TaxID=2837387 RepID=A0ABS5V7W8_9GAMM|nr:hypothetical protein [Shewanella jiangmenensis]MBT1446542.1 hypothetical protein [Shewanella jiangmenensis]
MTKDYYPFISHEEEYKGYVIYVENNPDSYRGGYEYSVSDGEAIIEDGLVFDVEDALQSARSFIDSLG